MPHVRRFRSAVLAHAQTLGWKLGHQIFEVAADRGHRAETAELAAFLKTPFERDLPVAFLNLCAGKEPLIDEWHWVTLIGVDIEGSTIHAHILDNGALSRADLSLWYTSTTRAGGFVYFEPL